MLRFRPTRIVLALLLLVTLGQWSSADRKPEFRYKYVSLSQITLPPGFSYFFPSTICNDGRVCGTVTDVNYGDEHVAFYKDGVVTIGPFGEGITVNTAGIVGGFEIIDHVNFVAQAALFRGDHVELIPPQPGETFAFVLSLNDPGTALVESDDAFGRSTYVLYSEGKSTVLDFGPSILSTRFFGPRALNNQGVIAGTTGSLFGGARGFRFNPRSGEARLLNPVPPDPLAWGLGVNNRGEVLGYSFNQSPFPNYLERIGVWTVDGKFKTYFVEGTPEFPTVSNSLLFNDNNLIVITAAGTRGGSVPTSYIVPRPGIRLDLTKLVENLPAGQNLSDIFDLNNQGSMLGTSSSDYSNFLLERIGAGDH